MSTGTASIVVNGATPAGAACAAALAASGATVRIVGSETSAPQLGLVTRGSLNLLCQSGQIPTHAIARVVDRRLLELTGVDVSQATDDIVIVRRADLISTLLQNRVLTVPEGDEHTSGSVLWIDARNPQLGTSRFTAGFLSASSARICVHLEWLHTSDREATLLRYSGESLAEVKAFGQIAIGPPGIQLVLVAPIASLIETSITLPDVLTRFLGHPAVTSELPDREPDITGVCLLPDAYPSSITVESGCRLRIGAAAGMVDPFLLDLELRSASIAGTEVASAIAESRLTVARLSRIGRAWSAWSTWRL